MTWDAATAEIERLRAVAREYGRLTRARVSGNRKVESRAVAALRRLGVRIKAGAK